MGPLQDLVTWYGINYTGTQMTQWVFQNKGKSGWTGKSSFVFEVPLRHLRPSVIYSVPCDRILQRVYSADLGGCYPPRPLASVDNTFLDLQNSPYPTRPHSIIAKYIGSTLLKIKRIFDLSSKTSK